MNVLLDMSLRGTMVVALVMVLERRLGPRMLASRRRWWWWLALVPFLVPIRFLVFLGPETARHQSDFPGPVLPIATSAVSARGMNLMTWIWAIGAAVYLCGVVGRTWSGMRKWSRLAVSEDRELLEVLEECRRTLGIAIHVTAVVADSVCTPMLVGWFRPRVLLPSGLVHKMQRNQLRAVLLHELAHCRAADVPANCLFSVVCAIHWFNPLVHLAFVRERIFQEQAADECAVGVLGEYPPQTYCDVLVETLRHSHDGIFPVGAIGMGDSFSGLKERIASLKVAGRKNSQTLLSASVTLLIASLIFLQPTRQVAATNGASGCPISEVLEQYLYICTFR